MVFQTTLVLVIYPSLLLLLSHCSPQVNLHPHCFRHHCHINHQCSITPFPKIFLHPSQLSSPCAHSHPGIPGMLNMQGCPFKEKNVKPVLPSRRLENGDEHILVICFINLGHINLSQLGPEVASNLLSLPLYTRTSPSSHNQSLRRLIAQITSKTMSDLLQVIKLIQVGNFYNSSWKK